MYTVLTGTRKEEAYVLVRPNRSLSAASLAVLFLGLSLYLLGLAALFWRAGAWTIVPFLVAEVGLIGGVALWLWRHTGDAEALVFAGDRVRVGRRVGARADGRELSRYWARVSLDAPPADRYPSRLYIGSHGRWVEIGACLTEDERRSLARELKLLLGPNYRAHLHQEEDR